MGKFGQQPAAGGGQLGVTAADVTVVSIDTTGKRQAGENGETQEVQINYLLSENARSRSA